MPKTRLNFDLPGWSFVHLPRAGTLFGHTYGEDCQTGILLLPEGMSMVASCPVLTSQRKGPIKGTLILGRYIDAALVDRMADFVDVDFAIEPLNSTAGFADYPSYSLPAATSWVQSATSGVQDVSVIALDWNTLKASIAIRDVYGDPSFLLGPASPERCTCRAWLTCVI